LFAEDTVDAIQDVLKSVEERLARLPASAEA
jgi:hypothetical protein